MKSSLLIIALIAFASAKTTTFNLKESRSSLFSEIFKSKNLRFRGEPTPAPNMCEKRINPLNPNYYYFAPVFKAKLYKVGDSVEFNAGCFKKNIATLKEIDGNKLTISLNSTHATDLFCSDVYIIHTPGINQLTTVFTEGVHTIVIENLTQDDLDEIKVNSIKILGFCQGIGETIRSLIMSLLLYVGGLGDDPENPDPLFRPSVPDYMLENNKAMVKFYNNFTSRDRNDTVIDLDEKYIHSGDFIAISRYDGVNNYYLILF